MSKVVISPTPTPGGLSKRSPELQTWPDPVVLWEFVFGCKHHPSLGAQCSMSAGSAEISSPQSTSWSHPALGIAPFVFRTFQSFSTSVLQCPER